MENQPKLQQGYNTSVLQKFVSVCFMSISILINKLRQNESPTGLVQHIERLHLVLNQVIRNFILLLILLF